LKHFLSRVNDLIPEVKIIIENLLRFDKFLPTFFIPFFILIQGVQFSYVRIIVQTLQDHDTVINIIDAVVARTEMFSGVAAMSYNSAD